MSGNTHRFSKEEEDVYDQRRKQKEGLIFWCLAPAVLLVTLFIAIPTIDVFRTAFYQKSNFVSEETFAGLFNFKLLFQDPRFIESMQNSILYVVLITILTLYWQYCLQLY